MERTVKFPKTLNPATAICRGTPSLGSLIRLTNEKCLYLCRCQDLGEGSMPYWSVGLFAGGKVEHGSLKYLVHPIRVDDGKKLYEDDYTISFDRTELVGVPCVYFGDNGNLINGTLVSYYKDGDCGVINAISEELYKVEAFRVRFVSDILAMEE